MAKDKNDIDVYDDDRYDDTARTDDVSDDDLDLSELLEKYMIEPSDASGAAADEQTAEDVDAAVYKEFASEVYSDDEASREAANAAEVLGESDGVADDGDIDDRVGYVDPNELGGDAAGPLYDGYSDELTELAELDELAKGDGEGEKAPEVGENAEESGEASGENGDFVDYEAKEEPIDLDENVDATDVNLMLAFGLDDELKRTMGENTARRLTEEIDEEQRQRDEKVRKTVENEYMNPSQTAEIARYYKRRSITVRIKLALGAIFAIVLFFYENLPMFGYEFTGAFDATVYPTVYIMVSLQLMLLVAACAYEQIITGFIRLFTGKPDSRSVAAVATLAATVYSAILPKMTVLARRPLVVNFAVALILVFALVGEYYNTRREVFTFTVVSEKRPKHVITKVDDVPELETNAESDDEEAGDVLRFETASFVDGYFTRSRESTRAGRSYAIAALVIGLAAAAAAGLYTKFISSSPSAVSVFENSFCAFFAAIPVSMFIAVSYPFFCASRDAYASDGAIIGECSLEEYSYAKCVMFDDIGVFPSYGVRVQNVKIYNNHRIDRVLFYAASVFSAARGPLTDVFEMATVEIGHSDNVKIKAAGSGYLAASVDDKNITFGSAAELISRHFDIPEAVTAEDEETDEDVSVMYMFREEKLMAKLFIKYSMDADFESIMAALCDENISVSIKTYDPNIDNDLISSGLVKKDKYLYSVTRYEGADDAIAVRDSVDSGIVSRSTAKTLLQLISDCTKVIAARRAGTVIGVISAAAAALLVPLVIASGRTGALTSGIIAMYQLFWLVPAYISSRFNVR